MNAFKNTFSGKNVLITGHTGFKGSWLTIWLNSLGAKVSGFALAPEERCLFRDANLENLLENNLYADIADYEVFKRYYLRVEPDFVFHLAAQPLVRYSYEAPIETFRTNVLGTVHVLEALRGVEKPTTAILVTTDKAYSNQEWLYSYRENDRWGGHDPYSASKGAAEIAIDSYLRSYFSTEDALVKLSTARAGNVIGGGDWAEDRIIPDCIRALEKKEAIPVRNKVATRPWQHVLEPLSGYLHLAHVISDGEKLNASIMDYMKGFNFGPELKSNRTVQELVKELLKHMEGEWNDVSDPNALHEASKLNLAIDKAFHLLGWFPVWDFETTIEKTAVWYQNTVTSARSFTEQQINEYTKDAHKLNLKWAS